jgi:hypothetical protein
MLSGAAETAVLPKWKEALRHVPGLVEAKRALWRAVGKGPPATSLDLLNVFKAFAPNSAGDYHQRSVLTVQTINSVFPALVEASKVLGHEPAILKSSRDLELSPSELAAAERLKGFFDIYGSDKSSYHDYQLVYGPILSRPEGIAAVLEVGLGTNNTTVVSHMGARGHPGASLRAFRDFLPHAKIFGADVDRSILFSEERITTFYVDQTDPASLRSLADELPREIDLIIDDGLHAPDANINTLAFALPRLKAGGWLVVEDIAEEAASVWQLMSLLLPSEYHCRLIQARGGLLFAVRRGA